MMRRTLSQVWAWCMITLLVFAFINAITDFHRFNNLARDMCSGTIPNTADYCKNTYRFRCTPLPANCHGKLSELAPLQFDFAQIIWPDFTQTSIIGILWWVLEYVVGFLWNAAIFAWYVVRQPFAFNPLLWAVLIQFSGVKWSPKPSINPLLALVHNQKALGDASVAKRKDVHTALLGGGGAPRRQFPE